MDFSLSPRHAARRDEFRDFAEREIQPAEKDYPRENLRRMAGRGYLGLPIPRQWGGQGEDFLTYILLIEEISRVCASTGVILAVHTSVGSFPLLYYGTASQKELYLRRLASGEMIGAFALTETQAGSDAAALGATARRVNGGYVLNGCKLFITSGGEADLYTVFATVDRSLSSRGICAFLVEKGTPGLSAGPRERKMGLHGSATTELRFDEMLLPPANLLGSEGGGFRIALSLLEGGRIGIAAQGLGLARAALESTAAHIAASGQCGTAAGQAARFILADLFTRLEAARLLVWRAACFKDAGRPCTREASMAKQYATDLAVQASARCLDLWAAAGMSLDNPLTRYFCDAKVTQIYEGSNQIQRIVIARELLKSLAKI
ncbi:MAG: acyl-CoA dehydrogenase family protein [Bacillota bacterium]